MYSMHKYDLSILSTSNNFLIMDHRRFVFQKKKEE